MKNYCKKPYGASILQPQKRSCSNSTGNVLIYVVVVMLIFGVLGVIMVSLFTSSTASTVTRNDTRRARYLSESGVRYAISELRKADFEEDIIIDPLNTITYMVSGAGSFDINIFSPWFDSNASVDSPDVISLYVPLGELPNDFNVPSGTGVWVVNYDYITGTGPDSTTMRDRVAGYTKDDDSNLTIDISSDFVVNQGERICLAVEPSQGQSNLAEGDDLYVVRDARFFFPTFNGSVNINRVDYAYERLVDDPDNNRVILENLTASQFPNTLPAFPLSVEADTGGTYSGDFVVFSPRNYMVMAEGTSDSVAWGNAYVLGMNVYDRSVIRPVSAPPDITAEDLASNLSEQETGTDFFQTDTVEGTLTIGGGGASQFGSAFFNATMSIGGGRDFCQEGACLFGMGVRVFFLMDFTSQGEGVTFTLLNGANNTASSAGGDVDLGELMGYAGDSRTNSAGTTFLATAPEDRGLDPPKLAVEFDPFVNNNTLAYCNGANVNQNTRDDDDPVNIPDIDDQDVVQYVFWGRENLDLSCRSGSDNSTYDDNRHGPGLWQFDNPAGKVKSSPAVDPVNGTIYVGSDDNKLYAINPNGTLKWAFTTGGDVISSPAVGSDGTIYVGSNDNRVYAINPNGTQKWQFLTGGDVRSSPAIASDGTIYIGSDDGNMYALDITGTPKPGSWPVNTGAAMSLGHPAIGPGGTIYFSALNATLYARNPDGSEKWTISLGAGSGGNNDYMPGIDRTGGPNDGTIYSDIAGNTIVAINPDGSEKWQYYIDADFDSTPVVGPDGTIYFGSDEPPNAIFAVNPDGTEKWRFPTDANVDNTPALSPDGSLVYVVSNDGRVYAVATDTGEEKWSFAIVTDTGDSPVNVTSSPAVNLNNGIIYVGSDDTSVYALTPFDEEPRNLQGLLLTNSDLGGVVDSAVDWLNGSSIKGPWAVRLEVDRGALGDYELRLWMKQCINATCDNINTADNPFPTDDPFFKDTRIIYQLSPPNLVQSFQLDATKQIEFNRFLFGFTAAAGAQALDVTIADFALSFVRPGDPIIDLPEF